MKKVFNYQGKSRENTLLLCKIFALRHTLIKSINKRQKRILITSFYKKAIDSAYLLIENNIEKIFLLKVNKAWHKVIDKIEKRDIIRVIKKVTQQAHPHDYDGLSKRAYFRRLVKTEKLIGEILYKEGFTDNIINKYYSNCFLPERLFIQRLIEIKRKK